LYMVAHYPVAVNGNGGYFSARGCFSYGSEMFYTSGSTGSYMQFEFQNNIIITNSVQYIMFFGGLH
jgi:hypothetical protein